ncbi:MAG: hypothetical protein SFU91_14430 [Chloroherpetonaceae bacterium]|nr:hypothetical protein [Chloroherpetonaceae bacterium]
MNALKKFTGIVWMLMGASVIPLVLMRASHEIGEKGTTDNWIFWSIVIVVLMPLIASSLILFGYFAFKGEYESN